MKKTILHIQSWPVSQDEEVLKEFNRWYDEVHLPEVLAVEGYVSARRYAPVDVDGPYIAIYEIEGDPKDVMARISKAHADGKLNMSKTLRMDPPPQMVAYELVSEQTSA